MLLLPVWSEIEIVIVCECKSAKLAGSMCVLLSNFQLRINTLCVSFSLVVSVAVKTK